MVAVRVSIMACEHGMAPVKSKCYSVSRPHLRRMDTMKVLFLAFCISCMGWCAHTAAWGQQPVKDSVAALFDGIPVELRSKVKNNSVRRDRVNDWLSENVTGKAKTIEMLMPVRVGAKRAKDGT
jgi:hypothetical protein